MLQAFWSLMVTVYVCGDKLLAVLVLLTKSVQVYTKLPVPPVVVMVMLPFLFPQDAFVVWVSITCGAAWLFMVKLVITLHWLWSVIVTV